ncbi:hypothetical protein [Corynebacterium kalidii]
MIFHRPFSRHARRTAAAGALAVVGGDVIPSFVPTVEGAEKSDLSKVEAYEWRMICRNDDDENRDKVARYSSEEVTAL